jgi:hypothetical protein
MSNDEHESRLHSMADPEQDTWDLSPNDIDAIRWALASLAALRAEVARLTPPPPCPLCGDSGVQVSGDGTEYSACLCKSGRQVQEAQRLAALRETP